MSRANGVTFPKPVPLADDTIERMDIGEVTATLEAWGVPEGEYKGKADWRVRAVLAQKAKESVA